MLDKFQTNKVLHSIAAGTATDQQKGDFESSVRDTVGYRSKVDAFIAQQRMCGSHQQANAAEQALRICLAGGTLPRGFTPPVWPYPPPTPDAPGPSVAPPGSGRRLVGTSEGSHSGHGNGAEAQTGSDAGHVGRGSGSGSGSGSPMRGGRGGRGKGRGGRGCCTIS